MYLFISLIKIILHACMHAISIQSTVDQLLNDITSFVNLTLEYVKTKVTDLLDELEVGNEDMKSQVGEIFTDPKVASPFKDLSTEYQQSKFFSNNFGLVVSKYMYIQEEIIKITYIYLY